MATKLANLWPLIPLALWSVFGIFVAIGSFTPGFREWLIQWLGLGLFLLLFNVGLCMRQRTRGVALASTLVLILLVPGLLLVRSNRLSYGRRQIEAVYTALAQQGRPFPDRLDKALKTVPGYMDWYYQKHSEDKFAVVYLVSSDGWAMEYPSAQWHFIGYQPDGYVPRTDIDRNPADTSAVDPPIQTRLTK